MSRLPDASGLETRGRRWTPDSVACSFPSRGRWKTAPRVLFSRGAVIVSAKSRFAHGHDMTTVPSESTPRRTGEALAQTLCAAGACAPQAPFSAPRPFAGAFRSIPEWTPSARGSRWKRPLALRSALSAWPTGTAIVEAALRPTATDGSLRYVGRPGGAGLGSGSSVSLAAPRRGAAMLGERSAPETGEGRKRVTPPDLPCKSRRACSADGAIWQGGSVRVARGYPLTLSILDGACAVPLRTARAIACATVLHAAPWPVRSGNSGGRSSFLSPCAPASLSLSLVARSRARRGRRASCLSGSRAPSVAGNLIGACAVVDSEE